MAKHVVALELEKCSHQPGKKLIRSFSSSLGLSQVFDDLHQSCSKDNSFTVYFGEYEVDGTLTVGDLINTVSSVGNKSIRFVCSDINNADISAIKQAADCATKYAVNAFQILMTKGRDFPDKKVHSSGVADGLSKKDELFNELLLEFHEKELSFPKSIAKSDGQYFIQVLCNALWYITNNHDTINEESRRKNVLPIPKCFEKYQSYNDNKRKKIKSVRLSASSLESHSQALYSILLKPVVKSSPSWCEMHDDIKALADCLFFIKLFWTVKLRK